MQTSQMISVIREKAIEANPEIVELKFGCEIENLRGIRGKVLEVQKYENESDCVDYWTNGSGVREPVTYLTIIGRPIRLADVLLAVREKETPDLGDPYSPFLFVNAWGIFYFFSGSFRDRELVRCEYGNLGWNLDSDDLSLQSPETIEFIYNLVK